MFCVLVIPSSRTDLHQSNLKRRQSLSSSHIPWGSNGLYDIIGARHTFRGGAMDCVSNIIAARHTFRGGGRDCVTLLELVTRSVGDEWIV